MQRSADDTKKYRMPITLKEISFSFMIGGFEVKAKLIIIYIKCK